MRAEGFVEEITDGVTDEGGGRQQKGQRGVLANQRDEGLLAHGGFTAGVSSLAFEQRFGAFGSFLDQKPHLRVAGREVGMNAVFLERFAGSRADRGDQHFRKGRAHIILEALLGGDAQQMIDLYGGGEQRHIYFFGGDAFGSFAQRPGIFGQLPLVHADRRHLRAPRAQPVQQFRTGLAIFLHSDPSLGPAFSGAQDLVPGVGLGDGDCNRDFQLA